MIEKLKELSKYIPEVYIKVYPDGSSNISDNNTGENLAVVENHTNLLAVLDKLINKYKKYSFTIKLQSDVFNKPQHLRDYLSGLASLANADIKITLDN